MSKEPEQTLHAAVVSVPGEHACTCGECWGLVEGPAHVVAEGAFWQVLHPQCVSRRYGSEDALGAPCYGPDIREISPQDRIFAERGPGAWLAQFEPEPHGPPARKPKLPAAMLLMPELRGWGTSAPWPWWQRGTELSVYRLKDESTWILSQHVDGTNKLVPWPAFPQWDEWIPGGVAKPDPDLGVLTVADLSALDRYFEPLLRSKPARGSDWLELASSELLWIV